MKTIQLTDEQYNALMQGEAVTIELPKPKQWRPKGGDWYVSHYGMVDTDYPSEYMQDFGTRYPTQEAAEKARDAMRVHNRLLAWLSENDDGWVADWSDYNQGKWSVCYNYTRGAWGTIQKRYAETPGEVYMSEANAEKLCELLNRGVVGAVHTPRDVPTKLKGSLVKEKPRKKLKTLFQNRWRRIPRSSANECLSITTGLKTS